METSEQKAERKAAVASALAASSETDTAPTFWGTKEAKGVQFTLAVAVYEATGVAEQVTSAQLQRIAARLVASLAKSGNEELIDIAKEELAKRDGRGRKKGS